MSDPITSPDHYKQHPSGIECIDLVERLGFCPGNAIKYLWRAGKKGDAIDDLRKARWYVERGATGNAAGTLSYVTEDDAEVIERVCAGFEVLTGSAIAFVVHGDAPRALACIDALIAREAGQ